jgi:mediator of RNA polymerase II transcription subunit 8
LASLSSTLSNYSEVLERTATYPLPQFPTTEQEGLLTTLFRKKATPEVVEWIDESKRQSTDILLKDDEELTKWAARCTVDTKDKYNFSGFYTKEEQEKGQNKEDEDAKMSEEEQPSYTVDQVLKFMYQGDIPNH